MKSTQGTPVDHLALVAKGADVPELYVNVTIGKTVLNRPPHLEYNTDGRQRQPQFSCETGLFA